VRLLKLTTLAVAAVAPAVWVLWPSGAAPLPAASAQPATGQAAPFAPSLAGTRPDGDVRHDGAGHLLINEELAHLFDYYLSALGEQDLPAIRAGIERELRQRLKPAAAAEAIVLLDRYLAYKRALAGLERTLPAAADPARAARTRLEAMQRLRRDYFSATELAGLFGMSDARDRDAIARLEIAQDRNLGDAERRARLSAAESRMSAAERAERDAPVRILVLEASVQEARGRGADDNEVYRLRAAALSPEAAARLAEVDGEEADWQRRIAAYRADRARLQGASAATQQQLRDARFTPQEQKRLAAYE
jgi:lipase chaperone LimK